MVRVRILRANAMVSTLEANARVGQCHDDGWSSPTHINYFFSPPHSPALNHLPFFHLPSTNPLPFSKHLHLFAPTKGDKGLNALAEQA